VDGRVRRWGRVAATSASSSHRRDRNTIDWISGARKPTDIPRDSDKHNGHRRQLECQRCARGKYDARNYHLWRFVHRACRLAISGDTANHRHQPRRFDKIRHGFVGGHERHHAELDAESRERGTRRDANISNNSDEQWASGHLDTLEPLGAGLYQRVRHSERDRKVHRAADSSIAGERDTDSAKRG